MGKEIFFMIDKALEVRGKILDKVLPAHFLYGGIELEQKGIVKIEDYTLWNIFKHRRKDIVVTNRLKHVLLMKFLGQRIILINMNSNHDLIKRKGLKNLLKYYFNYFNYKFCNQIICLSNVQTGRLKEIGIKNHSVIPLGVDWDFIRKVPLSHEYFISSGFDQGKDFDFVQEALEGFDLKILRGKPPIPYSEYIKIIGKARAVVFKLNIDKPDSSDLSGTTTSFEALLMGKPLITNDQPWLKELYGENYYVYETEEELRALVKKNIKFKKRDYQHLTLDNWTFELEKIINTF